MKFKNFEKPLSELREKLLGRGKEYTLEKERLKREQREIIGPVIEEARKKRNQLLEDRGVLQMSREDFNTYFASKDFDIGADLEQGGVADCQLVA